MWRRRRGQRDSERAFPTVIVPQTASAYLEGGGTRRIGNRSWAASVGEAGVSTVATGFEPGVHEDFPIVGARLSVRKKRLSLGPFFRALKRPHKPGSAF